MPTRANAGILALNVDACLAQGAVRVNSAFRSTTIVRVSIVIWEAGTHCPVCYHPAVCVGTTYCWDAWVGWLSNCVNWQLLLVICLHVIKIYYELSSGVCLRLITTEHFSACAIQCIATSNNKKNIKLTWLAAVKGIPCHAIGTAAYRIVVIHITVSIYSTGARTRVHTFLIYASQVLWTFWIDDTFRPTLLVRITKVVLLASTNTTSSFYMTFSIYTTSSFMTGVITNWWCGWNCK